MIVVVMGVTGAGKTTVGRLLAAALRADFLDADDYHSPANVEKMRRGVPLGDDDRWPWLAHLNDTLRSHARRGGGAVLACSALKEAYRDVLLRDLPAARLVYLRGSPALIGARLADRRGHYMNPALLASQFAALEAPREAIAVDVDDEPAALVAQIAAALARGVSRGGSIPAPRGRGAA